MEIPIRNRARANRKEGRWLIDYKSSLVRKMSESNIISPVVAHSNSQPRLSQVSAYDCFLRHFYNQVYKPGTEKTLVDVHRIAEERWKVRIIHM